MSSSLYHYDAHGVLSRVETAEHDGLRFWSGGRVVNELRTRAGATSQLTWLRAEGVPLSELIGGSGARKSLLGSGPGGSVVLEADQAVRAVHYAAHGHRGSEGALTEPAFNGEMLDAFSGCYLLGAGHHRPYSPVLGLFLAPDRAGPFGGGGGSTP